MLSLKDRSEIILLIKQEVTTAIGCTEPIAVALAASKATELLGCLPDGFTVLLSPNVLKNAMGVGIPGTGMSGLPIAIVMGALVGKSEYGLEVLKDVNPESVEKAKLLLRSMEINIGIKEDISEKLYIEVIGIKGNDSARVIISRDHSRFSHLEKNNEVLFHLDNVPDDTRSEDIIVLSFDKVCEFALESPVDELRFILKTVEINKAAAIESLKGVYGHGISQTLSNVMMGNTVYSHMLSITAAACDARMAGAMFPVMSNSGSGNQGIAATLPVSIYAEEMGNSQDELIRALTLSHLMTIYIKQSLGRLSGLCGAVVATTGASCGVTYLMGGTREQIGFSIKNMIGNITGIICDGAKPSCALKVSNGVSTAAISSLMAIENKVISSVEGITDESVDKTIMNLTKIGREGMMETDKLILEIMTSK